MWISSLRVRALMLAARVGFAARRFACLQTANIAINFALALIPMLVATGVAVDLSRALAVRVRLVSALDAAGLAVGKAVNMTQQQSEQLAQDFFDANYSAAALGDPGPLTVSIVGETVTLSATARVQNAIMQIVGFDHLDVNATSTVTREATGLELALVLDTTGSMAQNNKLTTMESAATDLVNTLFGSSVYPQNLKIGVVPFAEAVRVDTSTFDNNWVDTTGSSSVAQKNFSGGKYAYWLYTDPSGMSGTPWKGCVEARPNGLDETDDPPSTGSPDTLFVPMFQPDEPHVGEAENNSWNPAGANQSGVTSNFNNDYIQNQITVSTQPVDFVAIPDFTVLTYGNAATNDTIVMSSHGLSTGDGPIRLFAASYPVTSPSTAIKANVNYWIIKVDNNTVKLATSAANAASGTAINITTALNGVTGYTNVLKTASAHYMTTGSGPVRLTTTNTLPSGLATGTNYWITNINSTRFKFATTQANATAAIPTNISLTTSGSGTHRTNVLYAAAHGMLTGDGSYQLTNSPPSSLATGTNYWVIALNGDTFELATSSANATANPPTGVTITASGDGTINLPGVNITNNTLYAPSHNMVSGDGPVRVLSTSTVPGGIVANTDYWFIKVDNNYVKLATNRANAIAGAPVVDLTSIGSGTIYTAESPGNGVAFASAGGTSQADQANRQKNWEKYVGKTYSGTAGPYRACAMQPILPITNDKSTILAKISALNAAGNTHIPEGLAWGWRLVSPDPPFTQGVSYTNHAFQKAIVLMTDGDNTMPTENSTLNGSDYTAYGYAAQARMGTGIDTVNEMQDEMGMGTGDTKLKRICDAVKAKNIRLYTIAVQITNSNTRDMLEACATTDHGAQLYFNATDSASLTAAFAAIATDLSNLRVSH